MNQFFKINGQWVSMKKMKEIRLERDRAAIIFCPYCSAVANKHMRECPTKLPDFNPQTAHVLTWEEREAEVNARKK
jgi:hypothetical protein